MTTTGKPDGDAQITFSSNTSATLNPADEYITLTEANPYVIFEYKFTNTGNNDYVIDLFYNDDSITDSNISLYYLNSEDQITSDYQTTITNNFGNWVTSTIPASDGQYIYLIAQMQNANVNTSFSGSFSFNIDGQDYGSYFIFEDGVIKGLKPTFTGSKLHIPTTIDDTPVTSIAANAFEDNLNLTEVTIPDTIETIGSSAFKGCNNLQYLKVPFVGGKKDIDVQMTESAIIIDGNSLDLSNELQIFLDPKCSIILFGYIFNTLTMDDLMSMMQDPSAGLFSIPANLTIAVSGGEVYPVSFAYQLMNNNSLILLNGVTDIGTEAFTNCSGLTSIYIPSSVENIGAFPFGYCTNLSSIKVDSANTHYSSRNQDETQECNCLIDIAKKQLMVGIANTIIPDDGSVTSIGYGAFSESVELTSIIIPNTIERIGEEAFLGCTGLTSITIPSSVTSIGISAFANCSSLKEVTIESVSVCNYNMLNSAYITNYVTTIKAKYQISELASHGFSEEEVDGYWVYTK